MTIPPPVLMIGVFRVLPAKPRGKENEIRSNCRFDLFIDNSYLLFQLMPVLLRIRAGLVARRRTWW
jgi:hypothetical protein